MLRFLIYLIGFLGWQCSLESQNPWYILRCRGLDFATCQINEAAVYRSISTTRFSPIRSWLWITYVSFLRSGWDGSWGGVIQWIPNGSDGVHCLPLLDLFNRQVSLHPLNSYIKLTLTLAQTMLSIAFFCYWSGFKLSQPIQLPKCVAGLSLKWNSRMRRLQSHRKKQPSISSFLISWLSIRR